jgi:hypothetical protein
MSSCVTPAAPSHTDPTTSTLTMRLSAAESCVLSTTHRSGMSVQMGRIVAANSGSGLWLLT